MPKPDGHLRVLAHEINVAVCCHTDELAGHQYASISCIESPEYLLARYFHVSRKDRWNFWKTLPIIRPVSRDTITGCDQLFDFTCSPRRVVSCYTRGVFNIFPPFANENKPRSCPRK